MPCVLWVSGDFTSEEIISNTQLLPYKFIAKGETVQLKTGGEKTYEQALCGFDVSDKDFSDFKALVADALTYLEAYHENLAALPKLKDMAARLDFGYYTSFMDQRIVAQYDTLPHRLLKLAGDLQIDIELSQYWHGDTHPN
jgi:hypothetical protein